MESAESGNHQKEEERDFKKVFDKFHFIVYLSLTPTPLPGERDKINLLIDRDFFSVNYCIRHTKIFSVFNEIFFRYIAKRAIVDINISRWFIAQTFNINSIWLSHSQRYLYKRRLMLAGSGN